jgi:hypothetical protein
MALTFVFVTLLYALTMPVEIQWNGDAIVEVQSAASDNDVLRSNHPLQTVSFRAWYQVGAGLGLADPAFIWIQLLNVLCGAASVTLLLGTLRHLQIEGRAALLACLVYAVTFAHWLHAREAESAMISQVCLLAGMYAATRPSGRHRVVLAQFWLALSVLHSPYMIVMWPALTLLSTDDPRDLRRLFKNALLAGGAMVVFALIPVIVIAFIGAATSNWADALAWLTDHPSSGRLEATTGLSAKGLLRAASGLLNAFGGYTDVTTTLKLALSGESWHSPPAGDIIRFVLSGVLVVVVGASVLAIRCSWSTVFLSVWAALVCSFGFNAIWLGSDPQFWIPFLPFAMLGFAGWVGGAAWSRGSGGRSPRVVAGVMVAVLLVMNFGYTVPTVLDPAGGREYQRAGAYADGSSAEDLLIYATRWPELVPRLADREVLDLRFGVSPDIVDLEALVIDRINSAMERGGTVRLVGVFSVIDHHNVGAWEEIGAVFDTSREQLVEAIESRFNVVPPAASEDFDAWIVEPGAAVGTLDGACGSWLPNAKGPCSGEQGPLP